MSVGVATLSSPGSMSAGAMSMVALGRACRFRVVTAGATMWSWCVELRRGEVEARRQDGSVFMCTRRTMYGNSTGEVAKKDGSQIGGDCEGERRCDCARVIAPWSFVLRPIPRATIAVSGRNNSDSGNQWCSVGGNMHSPVVLWAAADGGVTVLL